MKLWRNNPVNTLPVKTPLRSQRERVLLMSRASTYLSLEQSSSHICWAVFWTGAHTHILAGGDPLSWWSIPAARLKTLRSRLHTERTRTLTHAHAHTHKVIPLGVGRKSILKAPQAFQIWVDKNAVPIPWFEEERRKTQWGSALLPSACLCAQIVGKDYKRDQK